MKKICFSIFILLFCQLVFATNEVPNPGFESWTSGNPDGWYVTNIPGWGVPVTQYAPGHSGSSAAKGQPVIVVATGDTLAPSMIPGSVSSGIPITHDYGTLDFYYQSNLSGGDVFSVDIYLYNASNAVIASSNQDIPTNTSGWTMKSITLNYFGSGPATKAVIQFTMLPDQSSTRNYPNPASYFLVDDVSLTGTVGIEEASLSGVTLFPVPAHNEIHMAGLGKNKPDIILTDALGKKVREQLHQSDEIFFKSDDFDLQGLARGIYFLLLMNDGKSASYRILVE
jgi:hypothetical protein